MDTSPVGADRGEGISTRARQRQSHKMNFITQVNMSWLIGSV